MTSDSFNRQLLEDVQRLLRAQESDAVKLARIEEKLEQLTDLKLRLQDHETRINALYLWRAKVTGAAAVWAAVGGVISGVVVAGVVTLIS